MELITYSDKGMVLKGATSDTLKALARECPKASLQPGRGGLVMSRKWEDQVRALLAICENDLKPEPVETLPPTTARIVQAVTQGPKPKRRTPTCNCPATVQRYDKAFPHKPGSVPGCHMGPDGAALDGVIRCEPHRMCKACLETDSNISWMFDREMQNPLPDQCFGARGA